MSRFDEHVQAYIDHKGFPNIHEPMFASIKRNTPEGARFLDLGCCQGLLAVQVAVKHAGHVIGVDGSAGYIKNAIEHPNVQYYLLKIDGDEALCALQDIIMEHQVQFVIARRIMPEIVETAGIGLATKVARMFRTVGVGVFLEGRIDSKRAVNPLKNLAAETALFTGERYRVLDERRGINYLVPAA